MSLVARRATTLLLAALAAVTMSLLLLAGPAGATEGEEAAATEELTGFGSAQADGMIMAAGAGIILGVLGFAMSDPGKIHRVSAH